MAHRAPLRADLRIASRRRRASASPCTTGAATATRCCSRTPPASTAGCGRRSPSGSSRAGRHVWSFDFRGHGDSDPSPDGAYRWEEFADDALAVTHHLELAGVPRAARRRPLEGRRVAALGLGARAGHLPARSGRFEPIIFPADAPILAGDGQPALGRRPAAGATSGRRASEALASYGVEATAQRARARRARGVRGLRLARPAGRHRRAQVPAGGRGDDVHDGREPRALPASSARSQCPVLVGVRRDDHLDHPGVRRRDRRRSSRAPRSRCGTTAATSARSRTPTQAVESMLRFAAATTDGSADHARSHPSGSADPRRAPPASSCGL